MHKIKKLNLANYVLQPSLKTRANHLALILVEDIGIDRQFTYAMLYHDVCCLMSGLKTLQLSKGTVICIQAEDVYDLLLLFLAANAIGYVPNLLLLSLTSEEINYILKDSNARVFFCLTQKPAKLQLPTSCQLIDNKNYQSLKNHPFQPMQTTTYAKDAAFIFYTSGSSGYPKGVLHAQQCILGRKASLKNWLTLTAEDKVMQTDNLCWTYSMFTGLLDPLTVGATAVVLMPSQRSATAENKITAKQWLSIIDYYKITVLVSTPNIYNLIVTSPYFKQFINTTLRQAGSAGAFLADAIQQLWTKQVKIPIFIALGMSEISTFISTGPKVPYRKDRLGKIQPGRKITILPINEGLQSVPPNTPGILAIHRAEPGLMIGYLGNKNAIREQYRDGWFLTQDIVSLDNEGYIQYHGRADMIFKVDGGFRVSPIEIENQLKQHPSISEAVCTEFFDKKTASNQLIVYVIAKCFSQELAAELTEFLKKNLSDYKIPNYFYFVQHMPMNSRGKVIRSKLPKLKPLHIYQIK